MTILSNLYKTLRGKIIISLLILIILPVVVIIYQFYISSKEIVQLQMYQSNQVAIQHKAEIMNELAIRVFKASSLIINDPETEKFLRDTDDWSTNYNAFIKLASFQRKLSNVRDLLLDSDAYLALYDNRGYIHSTTAVAKTNSDNKSEAWMQPTIQLNGSPYWSVPYTFLSAGGKQNMIVMTRQVNGEYQSNYGAFFIGIPISSFFYNDSELHDQRMSGITRLTLNQNQLLLGDASLGISGDTLQKYTITEPSGIKKISFKGQDYLVNEAYIPQLGWKLVQLMNQKEFISQLSREKDKFIEWVIFWFLLFGVAFIGLMIRFTIPIKQLAKSMNRVGKGEFNTMVQIKGEDEIALLGRNFNKMVLHLQDLISNLYDEQQRKQKAQFQALQAQINPHFLLNTLNSIKWMAILSGSEHVSEMIIKLGKLLNFTMRNDEEFVTLQEELDYLQIYMSLQEIRYHDQITISFDIPEPLRDCEVLKFTLQPAVENSIIHGNRFPLHIEIHAEEMDGKLLITMKDNGVGMSEETIQQVMTQMTQPHAKYSGIGIRNVNERIRLNWGPAFGIEISSVMNEGVAIHYLLPLKRRTTDDTDIDRG